MNAHTVRHQKFGRYDRITFGGASYRYVRFEDDDQGGSHLLQLSMDGFLQAHHERLTDKQIAQLQRAKNFKVEPAYFSHALDELRMRHDKSNILAFSEEEARTMFWRLEWCKRFNTARTDSSKTLRPKITPHELESFIDIYKDEVHRWYIKRFKDRRPIGRPVLTETDGEEVEEPKPFDYPSATTLRNWLRLYRKSGESIIAFAPKYHRCGNRMQLPKQLSDDVDECVKGYASRKLPTRVDINDAVREVVIRFNRQNPGMKPAKVSQTTVNRRIAKLEPFYVDVGRLGRDRALRKYMLVGHGVQVDLPMERVEIDDWEADLFALVVDTDLWAKMTPAQREGVRRVRCTVTVAIDCRTRCIVGLNVSPTAPSVAGSIQALKTMVLDKKQLLKDAEVQEPWPMGGRPDNIFTDGGPVFKGEFRDVATLCGLDTTRPDPDPRQRGTIEAFFRYLQRVCRFYTGQTFNNVVVKADYNAEKMASITVDQFKNAIVKFIVESYHRRRHRGLSYETPLSAWNRLSEKDPPAMITRAQALSAFGIKRPNVRLDNHGVYYLDIAYVSDALGELVMKLGRGSRVNMVINPDCLGDVLIQVPERLWEHMHRLYPMVMYGEFLEVPALDQGFKGVSVKERLANNAGVRQFVKKAYEEGNDVRIKANLALARGGEDAAALARIAMHNLTQDLHDYIIEKFRTKAAQATGKGPIGDEPPDTGDGEFGETIGRSVIERPIIPPRPARELPRQHQQGAEPDPLPPQPKPAAKRSIYKDDED